MPTSEFLDLREDPIRGSVVAGLSEVEANDAQDVMKLLRRGNKYRSQESTAANSFSSRSHAVLQVHIEQQEKLNPGDSTADSDYDETDNIENIKTTVRRNVVEAEQTTLNQNSLVTNLQEEIATLKKELLRQQEKAETSRHSPPESERRWVERKKSSADNNSDDEDWMTIKLREARLYITECFQERRRLRHALLKLEHQIQHRAQELQSTQNAPTVTTGPSIAQSSASPSKSATVVNEPQIQEKESDANVLTSQGSSTTVEAAKKDTEDQQLAALSLDREGLMQQLARNERAMDEFHRGIEQSPLMERNALIREVLLMEYRIGNLEIDKMQLQTLRDLQMNNGVGEHGNNEDLSMEYLDASFVPNVGRELHLDLPALASDRSQPQTSDRDSDRIRLPKIKSGKGFLEELREHLYPSKSNSHRAKHQEVAHTVAVSPVTNNKHWGLHLNNASLPYIRLKKKNPIPLYVQPTTSGSLAEVLALGRTPPVKSLAEPYLKSLKKRHKPRGKHSKNAQALK
ncbi:hypothetical protein PC119_g9981 [Phytophthora cactorum]|nr:hypothetical protein PC119_g9981 [Phytophthora cactorum]